MKLTARQVDTSKPKDKPYKLSDGGGLYLLVKRSYWRWGYILISLWRKPDRSALMQRKSSLLVVIRDRRSRKRNKRKSRLWQTALSALPWNGIPIKAHRGQKAMPSIF